MNMTNDKVNTNEKIPEVVNIQAADFQPLASEPQSSKIAIKPFWYFLAILLLITATSLWYLFAAKAVVITTEPNSQVEVSGGIYFELADHLLMLPGRYQVAAQYPGFFPISQSILISSQQNQQIILPFKPLPGHLKLDITPVNEQLTVKVDGEIVTLNNLTINNIAAGHHEITISHPNYFDFSQAIEITGKQQTQSLSINLQPAWSDISINSQPEGAEISENGKILGITPLTTPLLQGKHNLNFKLAGYKQTSREIEVIAQQNKTLPTAKLVKLAAKLIVTSQPSGVSVTYGDSYLGETPINVAVQATNAELILAKQGYETLSTKVKTESGKTANLQFNLTPITANVIIKSNHSDALLYVDNTLLGRANQQIQLPVKQHQIRVEKTGFVPVAKTVLPNPSVTQVLAFNLKTEQQVKWETLKPVITSFSGGKLKLFKPNVQFTMGASRREQGRRANEVQRNVKLTKAFYIGFTEVTNREFKQFMREHSSGNMKGHSLNGLNQPVVNLTWIMAAKYCNWLSEKDKLTPVYQIADNKLIAFNKNANGYRLPTEVEWVYVARYQQGKMKKYTWGSKLPPKANSINIADVSGASFLGNIQPQYNDGFAVSAPVGSFLANEKGLYDLGGNVAEWMHDFYEIKTGLSLKLEIDPMGPEQGTFHLIRGASWALGSRSELRLSFRDYSNDKRNDLGFRIARFAM